MPDLKIDIMLGAISAKPGISTDELAEGLYGESTQYTRRKIGYLRLAARKQGFAVRVTDHGPGKPGKNYVGTE